VALGASCPELVAHRQCRLLGIYFCHPFCLWRALSNRKFKKQITASATTATATMAAARATTTANNNNNSKQRQQQQTTTTSAAATTMLPLIFYWFSENRFRCLYTDFPNI